MQERWQVRILLLSSLEIKKILIMREKLRFWKPADLHKKMVSFILFFFPCKSEFSGMGILGKREESDPTEVSAYTSADAWVDTPPTRY